MNLRVAVILAAAVAVQAPGGVQAGQPSLLRTQFAWPWEEPDSVPLPPDVDEADVEPPPSHRTCRKMCASDFSPCDPIYFKTEDGRCDGLDENYR